jgi:hypothetical protein
MGTRGTWNKVYIIISTWNKVYIVIIKRVTVLLILILNNVYVLPFTCL